MKIVEERRGPVGGPSSPVDPPVAHHVCGVRAVVKEDVPLFVLYIGKEERGGVP